MTITTLPEPDNGAEETNRALDIDVAPLLAAMLAEMRLQTQLIAMAIGVDIQQAREQLH